MRPLQNRVLFFGTATIIERTISFFLLPILTNTLSGTEFAIWSQVVITSGLLVPIVLLGFSQLIVRFRPEWDKLEYKIADIYWKIIAFIITTILSLLMLFIFFQDELSQYIFGKKYHNEYVIFILLIVAAESFFEITLSTLRSINKIELVSVYTVVKALFRLIAIYIIFSGLDLGFLESLFLYGICNFLLITMMFACISLRNNLFNSTPNSKKITTSDFFSFGIFSDITKYTAPLIFVAIVTPFISFSDRFFIANIVGLDNLATYSAAYTLAAVVALGYTVIGYISFPKLVELFVSHDIRRCESLIRSTSIFFMGIFFPYLTLVSLVGPEFLVWIAGPDYLVSRELFIGLVLSIGLFGFFQIIQYILMLKKTTYSVSILILFGAIMNIFLNWFFVTNFSVLGAAISNCLTNFLLICIGLFYTRRILNFQIPFMELFWFSSTAILTFVIGNNLFSGGSASNFYHFLTSGVIVATSFSVLFFLVPKTSVIASLREF